MAEEIVEHVRLDQIVQLMLLAQPAGDREAAVRQMIEKHRVRNKARYGNDLPAGGGHQHLVGIIETGNAA